MYADLDRKVCTNCEKPKPVSEFHKNKNRKDGLSAWCKDCKRGSDAKNYIRTADKVKATTKAWKSENPERKRELNREYKKRNPKKVNVNTQKYKQKNKGVTNANTAKRRAALLQRTPKWLTKEDAAKIRRFYEEAALLTAATGIPHEVDHILPLLGENISGLHVPENLQILTEAENVAKRNRYKV